MRGAGSWVAISKEETMLRICLSILALAACLSVQALAQATAGAKPQAAKPSTIVNLNTATVAEFEALPGIGTKVATRIVDYRTKKGPFRKIEDLMNVQGIGEKNFLKLRPQLTVDTKSESSAQR
jgi:competence protein ComEA